MAKNLFTHLGECTVPLPAWGWEWALGFGGGGVGGLAWALQPGLTTGPHASPPTLPADDVSVLLQEIITEARNLSNAEM